ncbi:MAG: oligopeptide transporter, OPT family [Methanobacteriota archaeon]|nr:MAG: oligopeptide transporter, OPT family [Euryarchaeota archaeon]
MSAEGEPWIPADKNIAELTLRVIVIGILLGGIMTAANAYLGLYVGMTVSASIPAAVMSMLILRGFKFKDVTILENNSVQTMASAGESLAAGIIFTVPALLVLGIWTEINWFDTLMIALLGGLLGTMFTIALRRLFIVEEALPYPEGVACKEVLVAGEKGGEGLVAIIYALSIGAIYGWFVKAFKVTHAHVEGAVEFAGTRLYAGGELSLALLSVGFIVGLRIASFISSAGLLDLEF